MSILLGDIISDMVSKGYPSENTITAESLTSAIVSGPDILRVDYLKYCLAKQIRKKGVFISQLITSVTMRYLKTRLLKDMFWSFNIGLKKKIDIENKNKR